MSAQARLQKEYISLQKEKIPYAFTLPDPSDWLTWHFVLHSLPNPYSEGVYYGIIQFTPSYPSSPPSMKFLTPNGRFESNQAICTTNSNYHPESWTPAWNIRTILIGLVSHMLGNDGGIGTISTNNATKEKYAKESMKWNMDNQKFVEVFGEFVKEFAPEVEPVVFKPSWTSSAKSFLWRNSGLITTSAVSLAFIFLVTRQK